MPASILLRAKAVWPTSEVLEFNELTCNKAIERLEVGPRAQELSTVLGYKIVPAHIGTGIASPIGMSISDAEQIHIENKEGERQRRLDEFWKLVAAHPCYIRLTSDPGFGQVRRAFEYHRKRAPKSAFGSEYAEVRLVNLVVILVAAHSNNPTKVVKAATRETTKKAARHAKLLLATFDEGVRFSDNQDNGRFRALLFKLVKELDDQPTKSAAQESRDDAYASRRHYVRLVTEQVRFAFGVSSDTMVAGILAMMGHTPDDRTIGRQRAALVKGRSR